MNLESQRRSCHVIGPKSYELDRVARRQLLGRAAMRRLGVGDRSATRSACPLARQAARETHGSEHRPSHVDSPRAAQLASWQPLAGRSGRPRLLRAARPRSALLARRVPVARGLPAQVLAQVADTQPVSSSRSLVLLGSSAHPRPAATRQPLGGPFRTYTGSYPLFRALWEGPTSHSSLFTDFRPMAVGIQLFRHEIGEDTGR